MMLGGLSTPQGSNAAELMKQPVSLDSGSNKRRCQMWPYEGPWLTYRAPDDPQGLHSEYLYDVYEQLQSTDFQSRITRGSARVKSLLSKRAELELGDQLIVKLEQLLASFTYLLTSLREVGIDEATDEERSRSVQLAIQILGDWDCIEKAIPQPDQTSDSCLSMGVDYPHPVPSAWLFEYSWRDKAFQEVQSVRKKYSYFLDQVYHDSYMSYLEKKNGVSGSAALRHKKLLKFIASSREDLDFMYRDKCYKRVMSIKDLHTSMVGLASPCASRNLTGQTQLPNWRDEIYDQIVAFREMYSLKLDELLRAEFYKTNVPSAATLGELATTRCSVLGSLQLSSNFRDGLMRNEFFKTDVPSAATRVCFLLESLQFLANFRDDVAFLAEEGCRRQLYAIKHFMEDSLPAAKQATADEAPGQTRPANGVTNWRDLEYHQLQNKRHRFMYELYDVYLKYESTWSKMPECEEDLKKLESHLKIALPFYTMLRGEMSQWETKDDYYQVCDSLLEIVSQTIGLMKILIGRVEKDSSWYCCRFLVVPKAVKFIRRFANRRFL